MKIVEIVMPESVAETRTHLPSIRLLNGWVGNLFYIPLLLLHPRRRLRQHQAALENESRFGGAAI